MSDSHSSEPRNGGATPSAPLLRRLRSGLQKFRRRKGAEDSIRDVIEELIEERTAETATINTDERLLLQNILRLRDITAYDVMVPRADITAVDISTALPELVQLMSREAHSRLPVYRETLDDVVGIVHIKDVLGFFAKPEEYDLAKITRNALFVSPSMRVLDLLLEMRLARLHMAMVVDEYGGIDGLVTIEDLIESIVGDIQDEHDVEQPPGLIERPDGSMLADARTDVSDFEKKVGSILTEEEREQDIDTLGGLVVYLAGRMPSRGEVIRHPSGIEFEVIDSDPRRVKRLRIRNLPSREPATPPAAVQKAG
jgi:CBS domain containing-hemolysin-like protein